MNYKALIPITLLILSQHPAMADNAQLQQQIQLLQEQTQALQTQLNHLQKQLVAQSAVKKPVKRKTTPKKLGARRATDVHSSLVSVKSVNGHPESLEYGPVALMADGHVVTYIAGTPIVTAPFLGEMPAFDGSDYIVNVPSINRDIRLLQQRRRMYHSYERMGYPRPNSPIVAFSGTVKPLGSWNHESYGKSRGDWTLGSGELDVAAAVNDKVEAYIALAYDESAPAMGGTRVSNSSVNLNMGFVNIGDLDESPYYFTAGQLFAPFGRFSSAMVSTPLTTRMARTKSRPFILGYKSQGECGPFAAAYAFKSDTTLGNSATGGLNLGQVFNTGNAAGEIGASIISSLDDAGGIQNNGSGTGTTFGGFASSTNGNELVHKVPGAGVHASMGFGRYSLTAEWLSSLGRFHQQDLSFNGRGAQLQAAQLEGGATFIMFDKPASLGLGYQWSKETLALNMPQHRFSGVYNISIWKDTVESLEYRHDVDFGANQFANGAAPMGQTNANTVGTGGSSDTVLAQIAVYF